MLLDCISEGQFSTVYKATSKSGEEVAIEIVSILSACKCICPRFHMPYCIVVHMFI